MPGITSVIGIRGGTTGLAVIDPNSGAVIQGMGPVVLKRHDRQPALTVQLGGCPVDPSGGSVKFLMRAKGGSTAKVNASASFVGTPTASNLFVTYAWQAADVDTCLLLGAGFPFWLGGITKHLDQRGVSRRVLGRPLADVRAAATA